MESDEQTAAAIVADPMNAVSETAMEAAIVRALQAARTPPPGHIIDDAGVVRKVMHVSKYPGVSFLTIHSEAAEAAKEAKA